MGQKLKITLLFVKRKNDDRIGGQSSDKDRHGGLSLRMMAAGDAKDTVEGKEEAAVGRWVVIRAIRVIRLIRDSDTDGRAARTATLIALKQNVNRTSFMSLDDGLWLASYSLSTLNSH